MIYTFWNNKGGTGKTSLCFQTITEYATTHQDKKILCIDLCPQANLSELMLGGLLGNGGHNLSQIWEKNANRRSIGGYFQQRLSTPYNIPANIDLNEYLTHPTDYNANIPQNIDMIVGDRIIELQSNSISALSITQIPGLDTYIKVISWLKDLLVGHTEYDTIFIDTNPSFAIYTQIALTATERLLIPVMADDSSKRALNNVLSLIYGLDLPSKIYNDYAYNSKMISGGLSLPQIHLIIKNRLTQYMGPASAYASVLTSIDENITQILSENNSIFTFDNINEGMINVRDFQTTGVVAFAEACPFSRLSVGSHSIFGFDTQIRKDYLENCKAAILNIVSKLD
ncbi:ParA family protein [Phocaeicola barnesiae]|jgi:cellulose biosynthesis protein BcsQ|uniref:ParA family protein n=1 Tax=Phocaeicola barnesiae TaxID=376804 RepID=UPI0025A3DCB7|nr:ParA family protein [Phocaeicola barnesiae]MDM8232988.1 ParA family protein [Phocaeicola barnesiae]